MEQDKASRGKVKTNINILGIIPARGGSKGLKDKNILNLFGKPLIGYTIETALSSKLLDRIVVSTDSNKIAKVVKDHYKVEVIKRPSEFAKDSSPIEEALLHAVEYLRNEKGYETDIIVWMPPNVPIRKGGLVDKVVHNLINSDADSCVTCYEVDQIPEVMKVINEKGRLIPMFKDVDGIRRQEFPKRYLLDGSIVALRSENLLRTRGIRKAHVYLGEEVIPVVQKEKMYSLELDNADDLSLIKYYMEEYGSQRALRE